MGSCVDNSRAVTLASAVADYLGVDTSALPVVASAAEAVSEKAVAIRKTQEHMVITDTDKCIGYWTCVMVCPFGVVGRHPEQQKAYRCDRCPSLP
jgi:heterodisulfide reductase subunit A-like polyferredoxin